MAGKRGNPHWKKGVSGNPSGRPVGSVEGFRDELRRRFGNNAEKLAEGIEELCKHRKPEIRLAGYKLALAYLLGNPTEVILTGQSPDHKPVPIVVIRNGVSHAA